MYPWTGYADFTPTSCSWAQELYLQQRCVSRSKMRGDLKFTREDDGGFPKALIQTSVWLRVEGSWHKYLTSWMKRRAGPQIFLSSAVPWQFGEPTSSFNALLYSASKDAEYSMMCTVWWVIVVYEEAVSATGHLVNQWLARAHGRKVLHPDLKQTVFFHSVVKIS